MGSPVSSPKYAKYSIKVISRLNLKIQTGLLRLDNPGSGQTVTLTDAHQAPPKYTVGIAGYVYGFGSLPRIISRLDIKSQTGLVQLINPGTGQTIPQPMLIRWPQSIQLQLLAMFMTLIQSLSILPLPIMKRLVLLNFEFGADLIDFLF